MANLILRYQAKLSKNKQMWHLQVACSKFAIEVNLFFVQCWKTEMKGYIHTYIYSREDKGDREDIPHTHPTP